MIWEFPKIRGPNIDPKMVFSGLWHVAVVGASWPKSASFTQGRKLKEAAYDGAEMGLGFKRLLIVK